LLSQGFGLRELAQLGNPKTGKQEPSWVSPQAEDSIWGPSTDPESAFWKRLQNFSSEQGEKYSPER